MDVDRLRSETPGCQERIHLNNAGAALMPQPVIRAIQQHITLESNIGGYEAADARVKDVEDAYQAVAELVGACPRNIAFTENATLSYMQALSSIPFQEDDVILTTRNDYVSNQIQFLSLRDRLGLKIIRAPDRAEGGVDTQAMSNLIRQVRPKAVCVTHVPTNSGLVQDVETIGSLCRSEEVFYLVDACQSVGQMPIDVQAVQCDFLSATSRKFLRGPRGAGFLYVSDRVLQLGLTPLFIDMRGAEWIGENQFRAVDDAKRFENWEFAWALVLGTGEAARYALGIGLDKIRERVELLSGRLRDALRTINRVRVLDRGAKLCGIVSIAVDGIDPPDLMNALRERRINTSAQKRIYALLDYDEKGVETSLRISPHYYNTEEEIEQVIGILARLLTDERRQ